MFTTIKSDWYFIIAATFVFIAGLTATALDIIFLQDSTFRFGIINLIGLLLGLSGLSIRLLARRALGKQFSYALRTIPGHRLVTSGIYRHIRHPAYTGDLLFWFGVTLIFSSLIGFIIMMLLIPCFLYRISIEEKLLVEKLGDEYKNYIKTSNKLIPLLF